MGDRAREPVGAALARVLVREAHWLERAPEEELAERRARRGLAWIATLARGHGAGATAAWFDALGDRPVPGEPAFASAAWRELGAAQCMALAASLAPPAPVGAAAAFERLARAVPDWDEALALLRDFNEPLPPMPEPSPGSASTPPPEPEPVPPIYLAVAAFTGGREPELTLQPGRVEIAGTSEATEVTPAALAALERAAREAGAPLATRPAAGGDVAWRMIVPAPGAAEHVFVARAGATGPAMLAVAIHRVVDAAAAPGSVVEALTFGHGLRRAVLRATGPAAAGAALPAGLGEVGEVPAPGGGMARLVDVVDDDATAAWAAPSAPVAAPAPASNAAPARPLQPPARPADDSGEPPARAALAGHRALVADDSLMARVFLARLLSQEGLEVDGVETGSEARAMLVAGGYAFAFLDVDMPGGGALEVLAALDPASRPRVCALVKDEEERERIAALGVGPALLKPFAEDEVRAALDALRHAGPGTTNP